MRLDYAVQRWLRSQPVPKASLKEAHRRIRQGEFTVSGRVEREPKMQYVPGVEELALAACGTAIETDNHLFCIMNKPAGHVCQRHPREPHVYSLLPEVMRRAELGCVGRLDRDTTGTLLFCTDGGVQSLLLHPASSVWKTYTATLDVPAGSLAPDAIAQFREGMRLEDGTQCAPATLEVVSRESNQVRVRLHEGFFHQVKRMLAQVGGLVVELHRDSFGGLECSSLPVGHARELTQAEVRSLAQLLPSDRLAKRDLPFDRSSAVGGEGNLDGCESNSQQTKRARLHTDTNGIG
jgi:16S rRNA pseudouridine516 synthase